MKKIIKYTAVLLLFTGCYGDEKFERPEVVSITPGKDCVTVLSESRVIVEFSKPMDTVKTNEEFSLSAGSGSVDGYFSWDNNGRRMTFTPKSAFAMAEKYTVRITESAEDKDGNDLNDEFVSSFYTGGDTGRPVVLSCSPDANSTGNSENSSIVIRFSEPVDMNSIYSGISISPAVQGYFTPDASSEEITFTPLYGFTNGVTYSVNILGTVKDINGNKLLMPVLFSFTVGDDFIRPQLIAWQDLVAPLYLDENSIVSGAEKDSTFTIQFSERVVTDNLSAGVSISPSVPFYVSASDAVSGGINVTRGVIHFTEDLQSSRTYTLRISSTVTDLQGNSLDHDYRFVFVTDGAGSIQPVVTGIGDIQGAIMNYWQMNEVQPLTFSGLLYDNIGIEYSSQVNPSTLNIKADVVAGEGGSVTVVNIDWPVTAGVQFRRLKFGLYGVSAGRTYRITVKGGKNGLRDANNNYMQDDFVQYFKF